MGFSTGDAEDDGLYDVRLQDSNFNDLGTSSHPLRIDPTGTTPQPVSQSGTWTVQPGNTANTTPWLVTVATALPPGLNNIGSVNAVQSGNWTVRLNDGSGNSISSTSNALNTFLTNSTIAVTQSGTWNINNISGTISLPTGASTSANQTTANTTLSSILTQLSLAQGSTTSGQTGNLILGAVTTAAPTYVTAQSSPLSLTTAGALRVDGSGVTQPVSGTVTANQGGTWTTGRTWTLASGTDSVSAAQSGNWTVRLNDGSGNSINSTSNALNTFITNSTIAVTQSGTWTVQQGTPPWTIQGDSASGAAKAGNPVQMGGVFNTAQPTVTTGQTVEAQYTARGAHIVATGVDVFAVNASQSGNWSVRLQDGNGVIVTSQASGLTQRALDVGINVAGTQVDPRQIRTLTTSDTVTVVGNVASLASDSGDPVKVGGVYNTTLPSPSNGQRVDVQLDYKGRVITAPTSFSYFHPIYTTRIQSVANDNSANATSLATTINSSQSGSLIAVSASSQAGTLTCTDNLSQTYSTAETATVGGRTLTIFYKANSASGVTSVTISSTSSTALNAVVSEYADITSTPLDKSATNNATNTSFTSTATTATTQAQELLIGATLDTAKNNVTFVAGTGWVAVGTAQNGVGAGGGTLYQQEEYVLSTGTYTSTGTISANDAYIANIATFKMSSTPTGFTVPNTATVIKSGAGTFAAVTVNTLGTGGANVTFYDNTTNSGTIIATLSLTSTIGEVVYNAKFTNGLTMVVNSITPDFTVTYD